MSTGATSGHAKMLRRTPLMLACITAPAAPATILAQHDRSGDGEVPCRAYGSAVRLWWRKTQRALMSSLKPEFQT
jgi:hypothetical protein